MADPFPDYQAGKNSLPRKFFDASAQKSDTVDFTQGGARTLYVGGAGDVAVMGLDDTVAVTFKAVPAGTTLFGVFKRLMNTNTTATLIVGGV